MEIFLIAFAALCVLVTASMLSRRTGIAAPLLLLLLGIGFSYVPHTPVPVMRPEWILTGVLPPLLYASSSRLPVVDLRRNLRIVGWLSVVLVLVSAVVVGVLIHVLLPGIPLAMAIAVGAVVSPTDAVAATAIGQRLGLPPRLLTVLEGESLLNDASALVALRAAVAAIGGGFSLVSATGMFLWSIVGAVVIGALVGRVLVWVLARVGDPVLATTISFAIPFLAYFPAEQAQASGVIAVVVTGLTVGNRNARSLPAVSRTAMRTTWASVNFVLENSVFLLLGLQVSRLVDAARDDGTATRLVLASGLVLFALVVVRTGGVAVCLMFLNRDARFAARRARVEDTARRLEQAQAQADLEAERVETLSRRLEQREADLRFLENERVGRRGGLVLSWAGMRGVVTLAAAQTLPADAPLRSTAVLIAFLVAAASLFIFGGTLPWVIRRLQFETGGHSEQRAELAALMQSLTEEVVNDIGPLREQEVDGRPIDKELAHSVTRRFGPMLRAEQELAHPGRQGLREASLVLQRRYLNAYRAALLDAQSVGAFGAASLAQAERWLDREEQRLDGWAQTQDG